MRYLCPLVFVDKRADDLTESNDGELSRGKKKLSPTSIIFHGYLVGPGGSGISFRVSIAIPCPLWYAVNTVEFSPTANECQALVKLQKAKS